MSPLVDPAGPDPDDDRGDANWRKNLGYDKDTGTLLGLNEGKYRTGNRVAELRIRMSDPLYGLVVRRAEEKGMTTPSVVRFILANHFRKYYGADPDDLLSGARGPGLYPSDEGWARKRLTGSFEAQPTTGASDDRD